MRASTATAVSATPRRTAARPERVGAGPVSIDCSNHPGLQALRELALPDREAPLAVAFSGGADSTALLLAAWQVWPQRVVALHINHGLQAAAAEFEAHAKAFCAERGIPLQVQHVPVQVQSGDSLEAVARDARYPALALLAQQHGASAVLLGQHLEDQAETVLLALSRGAGLPGLSAMPARVERHGVCFLRPWLAVSGRALREWLHAHGIPFIEDPTNADLRFTRNRIRHQVLPAWEQGFPGGAPMLARTARHAAQAQALLEDLARIDLDQVGDPPSICALQALSPQRQANVLRYWLRLVGARQASDAQLQALLRQITACTTRGHDIALKVGLGSVRRHGASLVFQPAEMPKL